MPEILETIIFWGVVLAGLAAAKFALEKIADLTKLGISPEKRTKRLIERNQKIIADYVAKVHDDHGRYDIDYQTRQCIEDIAKRERAELSLPYRLYDWEERSDIPKEWVALKNHIQEALRARHKVVSSLRRLKEEEEQARRRRELFDANWDLVKKFMEIAERKVSISDEYGEENWDALLQEIATVIIKIAKRNRLGVDERDVRKGSLYSLPEEYRWLSQRLEMSFREYHDKLKARPANNLEVDGLSGVEFEMWIAKFLKERVSVIR